jgi:septal ring factor EnvC (AmiA/AmiB activator)
MRSPQEIFNVIHELKREHRTIQAMYKDALDSSQEYREILEKLKELKIRKKQIEEQTQSEMGNDSVKLETLKLDIKGHKESLTDVAISTLMAGETIKVTDKDNNAYEPIFSIRFRKTNEVRKEQ